MITALLTGYVILNIIAFAIRICIMIILLPFKLMFRLFIEIILLPLKLVMLPFRLLRR